MGLLRPAAVEAAGAVGARVAPLVGSAAAAARGSVAPGEVSSVLTASPWAALLSGVK